MIASRLLSILLRLQQGPATAAALAEAFEVSPRTIYRDVDQLAYAGVPVYCERGRDGGIRLDKSWSTRTFGLTLPEIEALLAANDQELLHDLGLNLPVSDAQRKLLLTLPDRAAEITAPRAKRILIDPVPWYRDRDRPRHLAIVANAMWEQRQITIAYASWTKPVMRVIDPLGIVLKAGVWYLVASCEGSTRTYRINQISAVTPTGKQGSVPEAFDLARHWHASIERFEHDLHRLNAEVRVTSEGLRGLNRMGAHVVAAARSSLGEPDRNGWMTASIPIESIAHATCELLALGRHVRVVSPSALRDALLAEARAMLAVEYD